MTSHNRAALESSQPQNWGSRITLGLFSVCIGIVVLLFNFHGILRNTASQRLSPQSSFANTLTGVSTIPKSLLAAINPNDGDLLYSVMRSCFGGLPCFVGLVLLLGLVRRDIRIPTLGLGSFSLGISVLAIVTWILGLVWLITSAVLSMLSWIGQLIQSGIEWLLWALGFLGPYIGIAVLIVVIIALWKWLGPKTFLMVVAGLALLFALFPFLKVVWTFLYNTILLPIFGFLAMVAGWLFTIAFALAGVILGLSFSIAFVGSVGFLLIDQLRTAWGCGGTKKGVIMGSFSLGVALSLIMLVSLGKESSATHPVRCQIGQVPARRPSRELVLHAAGQRYSEPTSRDCAAPR